jgi:hypothetical protein
MVTVESAVKVIAAGRALFMLNVLLSYIRTQV